MNKKLSMMIVLMAAAAAFGEAYDPARHGNPIVVTDGTVEIDGNGATISGGGTNRCATLGAGVTLKNFTFVDGRADFGGGVLGGRLVNCTIRDCAAAMGGGACGTALADCTISGCVATESGAALGDCTATNCTISGNSHTASSSLVAVHGGIAYGSTLVGCTLTGNRAEFGTAAPVFGGIGADMTLSDCTVSNNTVACNGLVCYGTYFARTTIDGVTAEFWDEEPGAGGDDPPEPPDPPPVPPSTDNFLGNATYVGWLQGDGQVSGTVSVKAGKASAKGSKVTVTVTPAGGRKVTLFKGYIPVGQVYQDAATGLTFAGSSVSGAVKVNGVAYDLIAVNDPLKSSDKTIKQEAKDSIPFGTWTFALKDADDVLLPFSVTVAAKTGKAKFTGYMADGKKFLISAQGVYRMDERELWIPVSYAKKNYPTMSFLMKVTDSSATLTAVGSGFVLDDDLAKFQPLPSGPYEFGLLSMPTGGAFPTYLTRADFAQPEIPEIIPDGEGVTVAGSKWTLNKTVGTIKVADGVPYVKYNADRQMPANLASLKLKCAAKTGVVTGSFKLYWLQNGKLKKDTAYVYAIVRGGEVSGLAVVKKKGAFPVAVVPAQ